MTPGISTPGRPSNTAIRCPTTYSLYSDPESSSIAFLPVSSPYLKFAFNRRSSNLALSLSFGIAFNVLTGFAGFAAGCSSLLRPLATPAAIPFDIGVNALIKAARRSINVFPDGLPFRLPFSFSLASSSLALAALLIDASLAAIAAFLGSILSPSACAVLFSVVNKRPSHPLFIPAFFNASTIAVTAAAIPTAINTHFKLAAYVMRSA